MAKNLIDSIQMEVRNSQPCRLEFDFVVPVEVMKSETEKTVREIANVAAIPGFRQGKAPVNMVKLKFNKEIKEELQRKFFLAAIETVNNKKDCDIISFNFEKEPELKADEEFKFTIGADVAPDVNVGDYKALKVEVVKDAVTDEQVEERLNFYRTMYGNYVDVEGAAQAEDLLKVSYKSNFELPEDATATLKRQVEAENTFIWLNEPETIPGCIKALTGAEKDKEYTFDAVYPADYREAALAGKTVQYVVKVENIQRRTVLTDEALIEKLQIKSIEEFREMLSKALEQESETKYHNAVVEAVGKQLEDLVEDFDLPPNVLESQIAGELRKIANEAVKSKEDADSFMKEIETHKAAAAKNARDFLKKSFILRKIAKLENISLSQDEIDSQLDQMSRYYGYKEKDFRAMLEKNGGMDDLQLELLNSKVLNFLAESAVK